MFFVGLGRGAITDSDEAYYAEAGREMVETGNWLTPRYNYADRFQKPILLYWLIAGGYLMLGVGEFAARLPAALSGLALVLLTYACARRWYDPDTAFLSGAIVATSFGYFAMARLALPDLPLTCFVMLATWASIIALSDDPIDARQTLPTLTRRRRWLALAALAAALACLAKGPVGALLPAMVAVPVAIWERRGGHTIGARWPRHLTGGTIALAIVLFLAIALPWYVAMALEHGQAYLTRFFVGENLTRFATAEFNEPKPIWFYLPILVGGLLPWSPFLVLAVPGVVRLLRGMRRLSVVEMRLVVWAAAPLLFYTVSVGKQPRYILPVLPPLAILLARMIHERLAAAPATVGERASARDRLFEAAGLASGAIALGLGALILRAAPYLGPASWGLVRPAGIAIFASGIALGVVTLQRRRLVPAMLTAGAVVTSLALHYAILGPARPAPVEQMSAMLLDHRHADERSGTHQAFVRNLVFYSGLPQHDLITEDQTVAFLESPDRVLCVLPESQLSRIAGQLTNPPLRLSSVSYLNTADLRVGSLLHPAAGDLLTTIVLVANR